MKHEPAIASPDFPHGPEAMTPVWLTTALRSRGAIAEATVTSLTWEAIGAAGWTTRMARVTLIYDRPANGAPATLVAKFSAPDASTRAFFGRFYEREVFFYRWLAPCVPLRVPYCYHADYDPSTLAHVLLLEDMWPAAAGDSIGGISVDIAMEYTRRIAMLHAQLWECSKLDALLTRYPVPGATFAHGYAERFADGIKIMRPYLGSTTCGLAKRLQESLQERWTRQSTAPRTLIHWDAHAANLLLPSMNGGVFAVVDWQNWTVGRGIWDVTRFCILSLPVDERRAAERDIVALYTETLATLGVRDYSFATAMVDYQDAMPLQFAQQLRFFGSMRQWDDERRAWVAAITPRVVAALHDAAAGGIFH